MVLIIFFNISGLDCRKDWKRRKALSWRGYCWEGLVIGGLLHFLFSARYMREQMGPVAW